MAKTSTWKAECRKCKSPVYYYPAKLLLESTGATEPPEDLSKRVVDCACTGEVDDTKHTLSYTFPTDFVKIG